MKKNILQLIFLSLFLVSGISYSHAQETPKCTVTIKSNDYDAGRVSHFTAVLSVDSLSSEIVATAYPGYKFVNWTATEGITIKDPNSFVTRITATQSGEGTLTAIFAATTDISIYLRPNGYWTKGGDEQFGVKYILEGDPKTDTWIKMNVVPSDKNYYIAPIPRAATGIVFGRFSADTDFSNNPTPYNRIQEIQMPTNGKNLFDLRLHFKPTEEWKANNARFAAYFYRPSTTDANGNSNNDGNDTWVDMTDSDGDGIYECDIPRMTDRDDNAFANYYAHVIFCRMPSTTSDNSWDVDLASTEHLTCNALYSENGDPAQPMVPKNLYTLANEEWSTLWETFTASTFPVTLLAAGFGPYGFVCDGVQYLSDMKHDTIYDIPKKSQIKLISTPYNDAYRGDIIVKQGSSTRDEAPETTITVNSSVVLQDNFKTKDTHTVYLGVPVDDWEESWFKYANYNYLQAFHKLGGNQVVPMASITTIEGIAYYRCEVPAEVNTIRFEKRADENTFANSDYKTIDLVYDIPLSCVNCYTLGGKIDSDNHKFNGLWDAAPGFEGDYRLVYYTGKKDDKGRDITFSSDIIRAGTTEQIVSLHINTNNADNPRLELQKYNGSNWVLQGEKLVKEIEVIDTQESGVWNFKVTIEGETASVDYDDVQLYNGNYYIRTNNAEGGWRNYTLSTNLMTRSSYEGSGYTHYFCRWIDINEEDPESGKPGYNRNVKFNIANDYTSTLGIEFHQDNFTAEDGILPADANVRWTWNEETNELGRAYINNLIATYTGGTPTLIEQNNWIYDIDLSNVVQNSKLNTLAATYPTTSTKVSYQSGGTGKETTIEPQTQTFAQDLNLILADAGNDSKYTIRLIYDFKINKTMIMLLPEGNIPANIGVDVFLERKNQDQATQVKAPVTKGDGYTIYATMNFTEDHLTDTKKTEWDRLYYWISFPFDVNLSDVFGFGEYGKHWIIEYYDGKSRAEYGCWAESPTYWRWVSNPTNYILKANKGYVLALNRNIANMGLFTDAGNSNEYVRLYFPSKEKITSIDNEMQEVTVILEEYACTIEQDNRRVYDSNWHMIGAPSYANKEQTLTQSDIFFYYTYNTHDNTYTVTSAQNAEVEVPFKSLHSYMVQYAGTINWETWTLTPPASVAARKNADSERDSYSFRLELQQTATNKMDQTFITMQPEGATEAFDMNKDLTKMLSSGTNIYTLAGEEKIQLAGSVLPTAKTTIPVGVQVNTTGEYTFSMPDGTDGVSVTLVDNQTGVHTNMLLDNYTTTINAGTSESRFFLVIDPQSTSTAVDNINGDTNTDTQKYLIDNQLIIRTANGIYDAQGRKR